MVLSGTEVEKERDPFLKLSLREDPEGTEGSTWQSQFTVRNKFLSVGPSTPLRPTVPLRGRLRDPHLRTNSNLNQPVIARRS